MTKSFKQQIEDMYSVLETKPETIRMGKSAYDSLRLELKADWPLEFKLLEDRGVFLDMKVEYPSDV